MGLQSALSTALTGMTAAETSIDVIGNNVANANTVGFKESTVNFATQFLQTQSIGSGPTATRGGTNPRQIGLGVKVAEITPEFTQGTIEISSSPLDIAIQGEGFFMVQGGAGAINYTRNGQFKTNSQNEIVTTTGQRVMGFGIDSNFEVQPTGLQPIQIPLGAAAVAQPTENVFLEGKLNPNSEIGSVPGVIQSVILSDGSKEVPTDSAVLNSLSRPLESTTLASGGAGTMDAGTFTYRMVFVDDDGNEGPASNPTSTLTVGAGSSINLSNLPQPAPTSEFGNIRIYRQNSDVDTNFYLVNTVLAGTTNYTDNANDVAVAGQPVLDDSGLSNSGYSYYVTYYNSVTGQESRPTARFGPVTADATTSPRIRLDSLPVPTTSDFDGIRIYRNLATDPNHYYRIDQLTPFQLGTFSTDVSYIDKTPDSVAVAAPEIDLEGPDANFGLPLVDVITRDGANYVNLFSEGELSFSGRRGGLQLEAKTLSITSTTTVQNLISFMEEAMGVVETAPESTFPTGVAFGGTLTDSRLEFTSNMGLQNELDIALSAFQFTPAGGGTTQTVPLTFSSSQTATPNGEGAAADFVVYDSLGSPLSVRVTTVLEDSNSTEAKFRWIATSSDNEPELGYSTVVGTGVITTDGKGQFVSASNNRVAIERRGTPAASPLEFELDFSEVTGLDGTGGQELAATRQDGFAAGTLSSFIVTETGLIQGVFSNGATRSLGQIRMARFPNDSGLEQVGDNLFTAGVNSGLPIQGDPGANGLGAITAGAVELSNTDIGQNLIELILASTQYRGGARVITAVQELLDELLALRR